MEDQRSARLLLWSSVSLHEVAMTAGMVRGRREIRVGRPSIVMTLDIFIATASTRRA